MKQRPELKRFRLARHQNVIGSLESSVKRVFGLSANFVIWFLLLASPAYSQIDAVDILQLRQEAEHAYSERDADQAAELFLQLTELSPDDPEVWFGLSRAYEWSDQLDAAIGAAERVQELGYASRSFLAYRLARLNGLAGHQDAALAWIEIALQEGYEDRPRIRLDDAFADLGSDPRFMKLAAILPSEIAGRTEGLQFDVDYLVEEAQRMHGGPDRPAFGAHFQQQAAALRDAIPDLSDREVLGGMMHLLAILGDGHTGIYGPDGDSPLQISPNRLPLKFYWFAEGIYVVDGVGAAAELAGKRILTIGDLSPEETRCGCCRP